MQSLGVRQNSWVLRPSLACGPCNFSRIDLGEGKGTEQSICFSLIRSKMVVGIFLVI